MDNKPSKGLTEIEAIPGVLRTSIEKAKELAEKSDRLLRQSREKAPGDKTLFFPKRTK